MVSLPSDILGPHTAKCQAPYDILHTVFDAKVQIVYYWLTKIQNKPQKQEQDINTSNQYNIIPSLFTGANNLEVHGAQWESGSREKTNSQVPEGPIAA